ncbi:hypothetical protein ACJQWK_04190 [Exserohilum turcicum]|uniref:N-acetyltransferase domain-containing protein n=1 Tax=Exserohilum turcicum (strain 28A) TaxID=671987 RepID=R0KGN8_EXST2|nr:uncharacterized protein SETTUDRAFT_30514 [Exserohilum turcica Et28A]EOA92028.1 hypothetical protein SETTUDRAFT_30514 [Exserohilum turcica Et28A]
MSQSTPPPRAPSWRIHAVTASSLDAVVRFVGHARREMFPTLCAQLDADVARWVQSGHFLYATQAARDSQAGQQSYYPAEGEENGEETEQDNIIATIGYVPYNHRFPHLAYTHSDTQRTVEVVRLYVMPAYRRSGLASALVRQLKQCAANDGVHRLYLHTHPFLPGAITFWEKQGFGVRDREDHDEVWRTTHMDVLLVHGQEDEGYEDEEGEDTKTL